MKADRKARILLLSVAISMVTLSCSIGKQKELAELAVVQFHDDYNSGSYQQIYEKTDSNFRQITSEAKALALFETMRKHLGIVKKSTQVGFFVNATPSGVLLTLTYETEFSESKVIEYFLFRINHGTPKLAQYTIDSPMLQRE